jgi:hypothetical protein
MTPPKDQIIRPTGPFEALTQTVKPTKGKFSRIKKDKKQTFMMSTQGHLKELYWRIDEEYNNLIGMDDTPEGDSGIESTFTFAGSDGSEGERKERPKWQQKAAGVWKEESREKEEVEVTGQSGKEVKEQASASSAPAPTPGLTESPEKVGPESPQSFPGEEEIIGEYHFTQAHSRSHVTPPKKMGFIME